MATLLFEYEMVLCQFVLHSYKPFLVDFQVGLGFGIRGKAYLIFILPRKGCLSHYLLIGGCILLTRIGME